MSNDLERIVNTEPQGLEYRCDADQDEIVEVTDELIELLQLMLNHDREVRAQLADLTQRVSELRTSLDNLSTEVSQLIEG